MKLHQHDNGVTAFYRNEETFEYSSITGDLVIVTIPFSTMRFVEVDPFDSISHEKWKAIRELHYMPATKIGIQFKSRFWEEQGQLGGRIITDLPIRYAYYPSYGIGEKGPAMMLGSYTWSYDALLWDGLSKGDRIYYALHNLATILGGQVYDEFISGISKAGHWIRMRLEDLHFFKQVKNLSCNQRLSNQRGEYSSLEIIQRYITDGFKVRLNLEFV